MNNKVRDFIINNWDKTIRSNTQDKGDLIGLPKPYTVPCIEGSFQEMYYWDTYFTNVGLILSGRTDQAINNAENTAYMIEKFGRMPNGSRTFYLNRSQPPYFSQMVRDIFDVTGDIKWLSEIYPAIEKEHDFWTQRRLCDSGLNRYYTDESELDIGYAYGLCERCGLEMPKEKSAIDKYSECMYSFCESGWDCTSRFGVRADKFNGIDLNSLLFGMEQNLAYFAKLLQNGREEVWQTAAQYRRKLMNKLMWDEKLGAFCDYDFEKAQRTDFISAAMFYPLFFKLATPEQAKRTVELLPKLEARYGVTGSENREGLSDLQWDYPNGWACLQYMVIRGLFNYGYDKDAERIAKKYEEVVELNFDKTGNLWEKYNVVDGTVSVSKEYETPTMMGWSAGVYLYVLDCGK